jgi:hypothetical protein
MNKDQQNVFHQLTSQSNVVAANISKDKPKAQVQPQIRQALIGLHQLHQQVVNELTPEQAQLLAAYHRLSISMYSYMKHQ